MAKNITLYNRINIGLALTIVLLLVFATNRIDKKHFDTVQNAISTLHSDRVVAQDYIYKMNTIVYKKHLYIVTNPATNTNQKLNAEFNTLLDLFSNTELTAKEFAVFERLQSDFTKFIAIEKTTTADNLDSKTVIKNLEIIKTDLITLSEIQMSESKHLTSLAQKSLDSNSLMSNLEIGFIVLIGLLIQLTIFYRVRKS